MAQRCLASMFCLHFTEAALPIGQWCLTLNVRSYSSASHKTSTNISLDMDVEIVCTTCYIKGTATAQFTVASNFNASQAFQNFTSQVKDDVNQVTSNVITYVENKFEALGTAFSHLRDVDFPTVPFQTDIQVPSIPECNLRFEFDGLELYMELDTTLSGGASYSLRLYESESPLGFSAGPDLDIGIIFTIDLLLSVEAEIDISSGFHILLKDGVAIDIPMFSKNISSITL
jgi:hypothetical protein